VRTTDPGVIVAVVAATIAVVFGATYVASRRALSIEPAEALRAG
jgi:ABC-type lipoprotein release transport system permease subunit